MPAVPFARTGAAPESQTWDWDAAHQNAILGADGDNWTLYKAAHAWWDGSTGEDAAKKAPYKLPHHMLGADGKLEAVWNGVIAAMARLKQSDIPEGEMKAVFDHLAAHYAQWEKTPPDWERFYSDVQTRRKAQAAARAGSALPMGMTRATISVTQARPHGTPTDDDLKLINNMALSPLTADRVYVFPAEISSQAVDAYFTQMTPLSLEQFAQDASTGVAVCDSHQHMQLNIGRSYYGDTVSVARGGDSVMTTQSLAYMLRGMKLPSGLSSDDVIGGMEGGIYKDVSIGFIPDHYWCSICGCDMLRDYGCMHWPGQQYETKDLGMQTCIAQVDARLAEYSIVYDGATPNAMLLKADRMMERGQATARQLAFVEERTHVRLMERWAGFSALAHPKENEDTHDMKGSEFVAQIMTRASKEISSANMDRLRAIHTKLSSGHDTMDEAMTEMASFMAEKTDAAPAKSMGENAATDDVERASAARASKSKKNASAKKAKGEAEKPGMADDADDGDNPPPANEEGDGEDKAEEDDANDETGQEDGTGNGEDEDDAKKPASKSSKGKKRAVTPPSKPGTDDGDGDDDDLPEMEESDDDDHDEGTPKSKRSAPMTAHQRAMIALGERARNDAISEALAAGARALGSAFNAQQYTEVLARASFDTIKGMARDFQMMARSALSPRGRFQPDPAAPGGGYWSEEPTLAGGRQTNSRDPNDPQVVAGAARSSRGKRRAVSFDPSLYKSGK